MTRRGFLAWLGLMAMLGPSTFEVTMCNREEPQTGGLLTQRLLLGSLRWEEASDPKTLFFLAGPKLYEIGAVDGDFLRTGWHIFGEMGGVWAHPIKLLDGFTFEIEDEEGTWRLNGAQAFEHSFVRARFLFERGDLRAVREEAVLDDEAALFITLTLENLSSQHRRLRVRLLVDVHLMPSWRSLLPDGQDEVLFRDGLLLAQELGSTRDRWGLAVGADRAPRHTWRERTRGILEYELTLGPQGSASLRFLIVAAHQGGPEAARLKFRTLIGEAEERLVRTTKDFEKNVLEGVRFNCSDRVFQEAFWCAKANLLSLTAEIPTLGEYCFAGVPEYVQLFGADTAYAVPGLMAAGFWEAAHQSLTTLARFARRQMGRVPHEVSTGGWIVHRGNANETAQFVSACREYFRWTADQAFLNEIYPLCKQGIFELLLKLWDADGDLYPEGEGMVERPGMGPEKLDVTCYLYQALLALAEMAEALGRKGEIAKPQELAALMREGFNRDWWLDDEGMFADSLGGRGNPQLAGHWTVTVPMEVGIADLKKGRRALSNIERGWVSEWGMVHTRGSDTRVWTLPTGVLALAKFRYGDIAMGLHLLESICSTLRQGMLGAYSELIPDGGDLMQLWSAAIFIRGLFEGLWGLRPRADRGRLELSPKLPPGWEFMNVEDLRLGRHRLSLSCTQAARGRRLIIDHPEGPSDLTIGLARGEIVLRPGEVREISIPEVGWRS